MNHGDYTRFQIFLPAKESRLTNHFIIFFFFSFFEIKEKERGEHVVYTATRGHRVLF